MYKYTRFSLHQILDDQVFNVLIVIHKQQHYGDEIVMVNLFVMPAAYILNFIMYKNHEKFLFQLTMIIIFI